MKQTTAKESATAIEQPEQTIDVPRRMVIGRIVGSAYQAILLLVVGLLLCGFIATCYRGSLGDPLYGGFSPLTSLFMVLCVLAVLGFAGVLSNFRIAPPRRFVREAIAWMTLLYAAFALHSLAAFLFFGKEMSFHEVMRGFCGRLWCFSGIIVLVVVLMSGFGFGSLLERWLLKRIEAKMAKQGKQMNTPRIFKVINEFVDRHPALVVTETKEYLCLYARYAIWGALLSLLVLEAMIAFSFSAFSLVFDAHSHGSNTVVFLLCIIVLVACGARLLYMVRNGRKLKAQQMESRLHE